MRYEMMGSEIPTVYERECVLASLVGQDAQDFAHRVRIRDTIAANEFCFSYTANRERELDSKRELRRERTERTKPRPLPRRLSPPVKAQPLAVQDMAAPESVAPPAVRVEWKSCNWCPMWATHQTAADGFTFLACPDHAQAARLADHQVSLLVF